MRSLRPRCKEPYEQLSKLSPAALAITKKANYAWDSMHFDKGLARAEKIYLDELMKTEDVHEGINAFLEKRPAGVEGEVRVAHVQARHHARSHCRVGAGRRFASRSACRWSR